MTITVHGSYERSATVNIKNEIEVEVVYKISTTDVNDGPTSILASAGVVQEGDEYNVGNDFEWAVQCDRRSCRMLDDTRKAWEITAHYTNQLDRDQEEENENPLLEQPEVQIIFNNQRRLVPGRFQDPSVQETSTGGHTYQKGILNPNNEAFVPQPEYDVSTPVLNISYNASAINFANLVDWANSVNSDAFFGADVRQLRLSGLNVQKQYDNNIGNYWKVSYSIEYNRDTWDVQVLNAGTIYKTTGGTYKSVKDSSVANLPDVVNLTATGGLIAPGSTVSETYTTLRVYKEKAFSGLGFSTDILT